jgi:hypothetical protein
VKLYHYRDEDLFPNCPLPSCPQYSGPPHVHILDHQQRILSHQVEHEGTTVDIQYRYCQGGVGSAKSVAFAAMALKQCLDIPGNEGVIGRKDFKLLFKTTYKDFIDCIKRCVRKGIIDLDWYNKKMFRDKRQGQYTTIVFENESVAYALQTKNWSEGLGASYGWFLIDDAMETSEELFVGDGTNAGLISRLRLPHVRFFKDLLGKVSNRLLGMVVSQPPPLNHWLHRLFGKKPGVYKIAEDYVDVMQIETFRNPFIGENYATGLMSVQHKMGRDKNSARRIIYGESVKAYGGIPVYPEFDHTKHVIEYKYNPEIPLIRSFDFGAAHPACSYAHLHKCKHTTNHYFVVGEVLDCFNLDVYRFYRKVQHYTANHFPRAHIFNSGDQSGYRSNSANKDNRSDMKILISEFGLRFKYRYFDKETSIKFIKSLLAPRKPCPCGLPLLAVDRSCVVTIEAFEGGYRYSKNRSTGVVSNVPVKDKYYDDLMDALRYGAENYVKWGIDLRNYQDDDDTITPFDKGPHPWSWMEMSDKELANMLVSTIGTN